MRPDDTAPSGTKTCSKCRESCPLSDFSRDIQKRDGLSCRCLACRKAEYQANAETERAGARQRYHANPRTNIESAARWQRTEAGRTYQKQYREQHRDSLNAYNRRHRIERPEVRKAWNEANRDKTRQQYHDWQERNRDRMRAHGVSYRAKKRANGGEFTADEWLDLKAAFEHRCLRCGRQEPEIRLHADHVIPVSRGGTSNIENIQPLCASCNSWKHNRYIIDFRIDTA